MTESIYKTIMTYRAGEEPICSYPRCGRKISQMIGTNISKRISMGITRYYCEDHDPDHRRY